MIKKIISNEFIILLLVSITIVIIWNIIQCDNNGVKNIDEKFIDMSNNSYIRKIDFLEDPTFGDVIVYNNDENPYEEGQQSGLKKCLTNCDGRCVEFGVSGIAFCFPKQNIS